MLPATKWDRKLVTYFASERSALCEAEVLSVISHVDPTRFWQGKCALIDCYAACSLV
jgi:hypothetical protein